MNDDDHFLKPDNDTKAECVNCGEEYNLDDLDEEGWCDNCAYADDDETEEDESD